jgi:hypothetical protein
MTIRSAGSGTPAAREARQLMRAEAKGWSQTRLIHEAAITQPAVAAFKDGGTLLTLPVLQRLALDADLSVTWARNRIALHRRR